MPLYDYDCPACGHRSEVMHGVHDAGPATCPRCGSDRIRKAFAAPAIHFKGSGWAKKERRATATPGASPSSGDKSGSSDASTSTPDGGGPTAAAGPSAATSTSAAAPAAGND